MQRRTGFIRDKRQTQFLILFVASRLIEAVPLETMQELVMIDPGIDYFEFAESLGSLVETGHLRITWQDRYAITDKGRETGKFGENEIAYSVRLKAEAQVSELNRRMLRHRQVQSSVRRRINGTYFAELVFRDQNSLDLMRLELTVPTEENARDLVRRYEEHPEKVYGRLINALFEPETEEKPEPQSEREDEESEQAKESE